MSNGYFFRLLKPEDHVQSAVMKYLWAIYRVRAIPMNHEMPAGPFQRYKWKYLGGYRGISDVFAPSPQKPYSGLFIELKSDTVKVYKKNGDLRKSEHLDIQNQFLELQRKNGYKAEFACGFDQAKAIIDDYFKGK